MSVPILPDQHGRFLFTAEGNVLRGQVTLRGKTHSIRRGTIKGRRVAFQIEFEGKRGLFEGELNGASDLHGTMTGPHGRRPWKASRCPGGK